jgi:hypothetical protein
MGAFLFASWHPAASQGGGTLLYKALSQTAELLKALLPLAHHGGVIVHAVYTCCLENKVQQRLIVYICDLLAPAGMMQQQMGVSARVVVTCSSCQGQRQLSLRFKGATHVQSVRTAPSSRLHLGSAGPSSSAAKGCAAAA